MFNSNIIVKNNLLKIDNFFCKCVFGKNGFTKQKIEGDKKTPLGIFALGRIFYRSDKFSLPKIYTQPIEIKDYMGWCDDIYCSQYNQFVNLPHKSSYEKLYRNDNCYDIIVEIKYNDDPIIVGQGSAIFLHIARENYKPTEGCIAVSFPDMLKILQLIDENSSIEIHQ